MAQLRQRRDSPLLSRPLSEFLPQTKEPSMLFSFLPSAIQSRLPRLPFFRRSASMSGIARKRKVSMTRPSSGSSTTSSVPSGMRTPEQAYTSALVLSDTRTMSADDRLMDYLVESASSDEESSMPRKGRTQRLELTENKSGIGWKYANQGLNLLSLAVDESSSISQDPNFGNARFARQLYLHAITYLIRALPTDLTTEEQLSIRSSLPKGIVEPLHLDANGYNQAPTSSNSQRSLLHRTLASTIVQFFLFVQFVLPYIKYVLSTAYQYDRQHKITEKVFCQSIETVDTLGKAGLSWTGAIYGMGNGRVGQVMTETASWFVEGITGGIHEGVGEGMVIMGAPKRASEQERRR